MEGKERWSDGYASEWKSTTDRGEVVWGISRTGQRSGIREAPKNQWEGTLAMTHYIGDMEPEEATS